MTAQTDISGKLPQIAEICRRYGVHELLLFGSALGAGFSAASDVDLLVDFLPSARVGLIQFGRLQEELEALLHRKVDLVPKRGLKPLLRESILERAEPVYAG